MIVKFQCTFGVPLDLALGARFGPRVEAEAIEFLVGAPIEWRLPQKDWRPGLHHGRMAAFHDLQMPISGGTRGTPVAKAYLDTRGIGEATVLLWLREGTFPQSNSCGEAT
jgi:hypothetical protein